MKFRYGCIGLPVLDVQPGILGKSGAHEISSAFRGLKRQILDEMCN